MKTKKILNLNLRDLNRQDNLRTLSRRSFMQISGLGLGGLLLGGCNQTPPNPSPISWQPFALTPVFFGVRDYSTSNGAPGKCRVFFPSIDGSPDSAAILPGRRPYPLILFAHGQCSEADHYKKWVHLPAQLAKCGYVVVVPEMPDLTLPASAPNHPSLTRMSQMAEWIRTGWIHKNLVRPGSMGIIGHSYGALLGARFATSNNVTAYVSLGGAWHNWESGPIPILGLNKPLFLVWGTRDTYTNIGDRWDLLAAPKHQAIFQNGHHWDYLRPGTTSCGNADRGPCSQTPALTADLVSMFFGKYLIPQDAEWLSTEIPDSLIPPTIPLTTQQQFYAGSHLTSFPISGNSGCKLTLGWYTLYGTDIVHLP